MRGEGGGEMKISYSRKTICKDIKPPEGWGGVHYEFRVIARSELRLGHHFDVCARMSRVAAHPCGHVLFSKH